MIWLRSSIVLLTFLTLITGIAYPVLVTGMSVVLFPRQAHGSLIEQNGKWVGSKLIGQNFTHTIYFHGRPSMTTENPYNTLASGGSNLAITNPVLTNKLHQNMIQTRLLNHPVSRPIPVDLVMASGSGLDPDITPEAAEFQAQRVANARHLPLETIHELIQKHTEHPLLEYLGEPVVNVLELNLALDNLPLQGR
ncbi:potassium-transporting ATPase subunit KdpC [Xenorhabdus nematophila]|uniref:Potassium-transporting ATPase KdpC subunit n=1 Tax=Xenorhabdus nematophila (strain ATCC 19061 / DSM 3370 / CCUG 14189 / LMG 1036 / NCIMB 9965 / AN6) TaxID=406817 RepID=D3VAM3_XENNA|nr:potassium-transporting ATPase subunit KdpC [Xenorhabdus nematophila]CEE91716.1 P-type ATPase, high-affinity potassium transport system, C chain [Xenorhabdus nematophila str. Anatoliense]CEF32248.1 P-type ATPase, high-affinity potassium transport system, C chain [Xenorhabdus nematophila str. Websteri]AYA39671.1 potassium-transporting ATPase subunit KdpC [Xenorhabdus nematophila]KHD29718.1 potassium-transporting ATPase subunit C [Xenorhabdus nematophila]MBA0018241.1 potassium-transporting ATP